MTVFMDLSLSLDGFAAGPDTSHDHPLGVGGEALHAWLMSPDGRTDDDRRAAEAMFEGTGAFVIGRRTFDVGEPLWGADGAFGAPCFVVTTRPEPPRIKGPTTFNFVTGGIAAAIAQARAAAGGGAVCVMGGATTVRQGLEAGLIEEARLHLAPVMLGAGVRLFDGALPGTFQAAGVVQTPLATHLRYRIA